jgi:hypothetical protein
MWTAPQMLGLQVPQYNGAGQMVSPTDTTSPTSPYDGLYTPSTPWGAAYPEPAVVSDSPCRSPGASFVPAPEFPVAPVETPATFDQPPELCDMPWTFEFSGEFVPSGADFLLDADFDLSQIPAVALDELREIDRWHAPSLRPARPLPCQPQRPCRRSCVGRVADRRHHGRDELLCAERRGVFWGRTPWAGPVPVLQPDAQRRPLLIALLILPARTTSLPAAALRTRFRPRWSLRSFASWPGLLHVYCPFIKDSSSPAHNLRLRLSASLIQRCAYAYGHPSCDACLRGRPFVVLPALFRFLPCV